MIRELHLVRDQNGFGFSLIGQHPSYVDSVSPGSEADKAGLRPMDCIVSINGRDARRWSHENVVKEIGLTIGILRLTIIENNDCSSDGDSGQYSNVRNHFKSSKNRMSGLSEFPAKNSFSSSEDECDEECCLHHSNRPQLNRGLVFKCSCEKQVYNQEKNERKSNNLLQYSYHQNSEKYFDYRTSSKPYIDSHVDNRDIKYLKPGLEKTSIKNRNKKLIDERYMRRNNNNNNLMVPNEYNKNVVIAKPELKLKEIKMDEVKEIIPTRNDESSNVLRFVVNYVGSVEFPGCKSSADAASLALKHLKSAKKRQLVMLSLDKRYQSITMTNTNYDIIAQFKLLNVQARCFHSMVDDDNKSLVLVLHINSLANEKKNKGHFMCCHVFKIHPQLIFHSKHQNIAHLFKFNCTPCETEDGLCCLQFPNNNFLPSDFINQILDEIKYLCVKSIKKEENVQPFQAKMTNIKPIKSMDDFKVLRCLENSSTNSKYGLPNRQKFNTQNNPNSFSQKINLSTSDNHLSLSKIIKNPHSLQDFNPEIFKLDCQNENIHHEVVMKSIQRCSTPVSNKKENFSNDLINLEPCTVTVDKKSTKHSSDMTAVSSVDNIPRNLPIKPFQSKDDPVKENSNLSQNNRSICLSLETILDDIAKSDRKNSKRDFTPNKENQFLLCPKNTINEVCRHRVSYSSGDVDQIKQNFPEGMTPVESWGCNFDFLLSDSSGVQVFMEFLKKELCAENLNFWLKCEEFKRNFKDVTERNGSHLNGVMKGCAKKIYDEHLCENSDEQVNVDYEIRQSIKSQLDDSHVKPDIFHFAQKHIYCLMKQDKYGRFKTSDLYKQALEVEKTNLALKKKPKNRQFMFERSRRKSLKTGLSSPIMSSDAKSKYPNNEKNFPGFLNFIRRASIDKSKAQTSTSGFIKVKRNVSSSLGKLARQSLDPKSGIAAQLQNNFNPIVEQPVVNGAEKKTYCPDDMIEMISRIQSRTLDDQRGNFSKHDLKLPEFLLPEKINEQSDSPKNVDSNANALEFSKPDVITENINFITQKSNNQRNNFSLTRRFVDNNNHDEMIGSDDFLEDNRWNEWLRDDFSNLESEAIIPTSEEADSYFCGGLPPPPLTIIERGSKFI